MQVSHIASTARLAKNKEKWAVEQAIEQVEQARKSGLDVSFDQHSRLYGTVNLSAILPPWVLKGSKADISKRLKKPELREKMKTHRSIITSLAGCDWGRVVIFRCKAQPKFNTKSIADISNELGKEPLDAVYDLLLGDIDDMHHLMIIAFAYRPEYAYLPFENQNCMPMSDATALAPDGPLMDDTFHGAYTWAAWFYRYFVREKKKLTSAEAVRRMTSLPAGKFRLKDRGRLCKGAWADIAIFDPDVFAEQGTTFEPNQIAVGMSHVLVNGVLTIENGQLTGRRGGQILRRGQSTI